MLVGDGRFELAFVIGKGYRTYRNNKVATFKRGIYLGGQMNKPLDLELLPETHITFVKLEPWAASLLSDFHFKEGLNETVPLREINKSLYHTLAQYHPVAQLDQILKILNNTLDNSSKNLHDWQLVRYGCTLLDGHYTDFKSAKAKLLSDLNRSSRTIETKFAKSIGLTPQQYAIGIRFRNFTEELKFANADGTLTNLAYKHGYYDQSHLNQDFKQYWGFSPKKMSEYKTFVTNGKEPFRYYTI